MKYNSIKVVIRNSLYNYYIPCTNRYLLKDWVNTAWPFDKNGLGRVKVTRYSWNIIKSDGTFLLKNDVNLVGIFRENFYVINDKGRWNYMRTDGTFLLKEWLDIAYEFQDGFGVVKKDGKFNFAKPDGSYLLKEWVDIAYNFSDGLGLVEKGKIRYDVDEEGNLYEVQYN